MQIVTMIEYNIYVHSAGIRHGLQGLHPTGDVKAFVKLTQSNLCQIRYYSEHNGLQCHNPTLYLYAFKDQVKELGNFRGIVRRKKTHLYIIYPFALEMGKEGRENLVTH